MWKKVHSILRARFVYTTSEIIRIHKTTVLSALEMKLPTIIHASRTSLDKVQDTFLHKLGITSTIAASEHRLLPITTKCDITALVFLFKIAKRQCSPIILKLFEVNDDGSLNYNIPTNGNRHNRLVLKRSIMGYTNRFNNMMEV